VDLPWNHPWLDLFVDPTGQAGRAFGVSRGWFANQTNLSPYWKLFCMMPWASLSSILDGYIGHPTKAQPWIPQALAIGQAKGRRPDFALQLRQDHSSNDDDGASEHWNIHITSISNSSNSIDTRMAMIAKNNFDTFPYVGRHWARRPFELATLRLQNLWGFTMAHWQQVMPDHDALGHGILTQQAGCLVYDTTTRRACYEWRDQGSCHVADFEDLIAQLASTD
jgi:hypothetical protein